MVQQLNFHKRQFKAYLALRGITKKDVARKMDMDERVFRQKSNHNLDKKVKQGEWYKYFNEDESKRLAELLHMSEKWQRRIFSKVILK